MTLEELYAQVPAIECRGKCQTSCGPIMMSDAEHVTLRDRGFDLPRLDPLRVLAEARSSEPPTCPALGAFGQCRVYDARPMICRLWGVVETMPCPHGCRPERTLTHEEGAALLRASTETGRQPLPSRGNRPRRRGRH